MRMGRKRATPIPSTASLPTPTTTGIGSGKRFEPLNRITENQYDVAGNKRLVIFPDARTQQWLDYDPFGQAGRFIDERTNTTNLIYCWGPMKKLYKVTTHRAKDSGGLEEQPTTFSYDGMGRPTDTLFPDASNEHTTYDAAGQVYKWKSRKNQTKTITAYDARGREKSHVWSDGTPGVSRIWDDASRLLTLVNKFSTIDYSYDRAGQVLREGNAIVGSNGQTAGSAPVRKDLIYTRYPSGEVSSLTYPNGFAVQRSHTARGQLQSVNWSGGFVNYSYLADGKVDYNDYGNGVRNDIGYDGRGFANLTNSLRLSPSQPYSKRDYWRDSRDRITAWKKNETGRGDRYRYDAEGQLTNASYQALTPETNPTGALRSDIFTYDALGNRAGWNHLANRGWMNFTRRDNGLNQYFSWENNIPALTSGHWGSAVYYDDNFQYPHPPWIPPGNGVTMADGWIAASYNALNQPVAMIPYGSAKCLLFWLRSAGPVCEAVGRLFGNGREQPGDLPLL
jgi:YD repeat-containing protein